MKEDAAVGLSAPNAYQLRNLYPHDVLFGPIVRDNYILFIFGQRFVLKGKGAEDLLPCGCRSERFEGRRRGNVHRVFESLQAEKHRPAQSFISNLAVSL